MTARFPASTAAAVLSACLLLAACASEPAGPGVGKAATGGALPPPSPGEPAAASEPVQLPPLPEPSSTSEPQGESGEPVIVQGPDGTTWEAAVAKDEAAYRADVEDCYRYALGQTERDEQYLTDRNAGIDTLTNESPYAGLRQRVDEFDLRNRRASLMSSCMESKGYARADTVLPRLEF